MDRGAWWTIVHGVAKSQTGQKPLTTHAYRIKQNFIPNILIVKVF